MSERPIPGDCSFWDYARGDTGFAQWLRNVDDICMRFLDQDLLSLPMIDLVDGLDLRNCFDSGMPPGGYFAKLLDALKADNGIDMVDQHVARQAKWGTVPYE